MASFSAIAAGLAIADAGSESSIPVIDVNQPDQMHTRADIGIRYSLSARFIYTQQMLMINYQVESDDAFISLRIDIEPRVGEEYSMLKLRKSVLPESAGRRYRYELNVLFNTSQSGALDFRMPELIYSEGGRDAYRFRFASQPLQVNALPPYLPPYMPMGKIDIESSLSASSSWRNPLRTGKLYYWNITLKGEGVSAQSMPDIRQQISSSRAIQFLPSDLSETTEITYDKLVQKMHYRIPFTLTSSGLVQLPEIRLQYFNAGQKRLVAKSYRQDDLLSITPLVYWSIIIILVAVAVLLAWRLRHPVRRAYHNVRGLYHARQLLLQANTAQQLRFAMNKLGQAMGWPANISLSQWLYNWQQNNHTDQQMAEYIHSLNRSLYAPEDTQIDIPAIGSVLLSSSLYQYNKCIRAAL